jgi:hypothetical protein
MGVRELIQKAASAPVQANRAAIRARIAQTVKAGGGGGAASGGASRLGRWLLGSTLAFVIITGGYLALRGGDDQPANVPGARLAASAPALASAPAPVMAPTPPVAGPPPALPRRVATPTANAATVAAPPTDSPRDEATLLAEATRALARGDRGRVLTLADEHMRRFPHGVLAEERESLRIDALLGLGRRAEAAAAAKSFAAAYPHSVHAAQVERALREESPR